MYEDNRQYLDRIEHDRVPRYETKSLDYLLPEWIINLKNYFKKKPDSNYSSKSI